MVCKLSQAFAVKSFMQQYCNAKLKQVHTAQWSLVNRKNNARNAPNFRQYASISELMSGQNISDNLVAMGEAYYLVLELGI